MAISAMCSSCWAQHDVPAARSVPATPSDTVAPSISTPSASIGLQMASISSPAIRSMASGRYGSKETVQANSSPPSRATSARSGAMAFTRRAVSRSTASPTAWPLQSLTRLKLSRSNISTATCSPLARLCRTSRSVAGPMERRLRQPVSGSVSARVRACSSARLRSRTSSDISR